MTLNQLIVRAAMAYPDAAVLDCWEMARERPLKRDSGDTLALFICREIAETHDPQASSCEQLNEAARVIQRAADELGRVAIALNDAGVNSSKGPQRLAA